MSTTYKRGIADTAKRAVLYARVSSDDRSNDGRNLAGQLEMCRGYALEQGWVIVAELAEDDRGASGASFELPKLNQILDMAQAGAFDVLVVRELDRLSRRLAKQLIVEEELKRHKVQIDYVLADYDDTPEGNLMKNMRAAVAEYERLKIEERMSRARRLKVKAGNVMLHGRPPYGYREVEIDRKQTLEVYESEARIVRLIYQWYTKGNGEGGPLSISVIARKLSEMRIPTSAETAERKGGAAKKRGRFEWGRTSLYRILKSETYAGVWYYGKWSVQAGEPEQHPDDRLLSVQVSAIVAREVEILSNVVDRHAISGEYPRSEHEWLLWLRIAL